MMMTRLPKASERVPSAQLSVETTINIYPPESDSIRLSLEIISFLKQNGLVSTPNLICLARRPKKSFLMTAKQPLVKQDAHELLKLPAVRPRVVDDTRPLRDYFVSYVKINIAMHT
jgi:phosphatidylinositol phospholipase C delta